MRHWKSTATTGLILAAAFATSIAPTSAAGPSTRWVDDDGHAGPTGCGGSASAHTSVQGAVNASHANDTVVVCPGTYREQVRIRGNRDGLTLRGAKPWAATIVAPNVLAAPRGFAYVMLIEQVDDVTVRGIRFDVPNAGSCTRADVVVAALVSRGTSVRGNRMFATGDPTGSCGFGIGVAASDSLAPASETPTSTGPSDITAAYNLVQGFRQAGVGAFSSGRRIGVNFFGNSLRSIVGATDDSQGGVMALGRVGGIIESNVVKGAPSGSSRLFAGVLLIARDQDSAGPSVTVRGNRVWDADTGIAAQGADGSVITANRMWGTSQAISLQGLTQVTVSKNVATSGSQDLRVNGDVTAAIIRGNTVSGACLDDSSGSGTAGTANTWTGDTGASSNPVGICATPR